MDAASSNLPINLDNLLHGRGVESVRVEFKAAWDAETTGPQALKTICALLHAGGAGAQPPHRWEANRAASALAAELIRSHAARGAPDRAQQVRDGFAEQHPPAAALQAVEEALAAARRGGGRQPPRVDGRAPLEGQAWYDG